MFGHSHDQPHDRPHFSPQPCRWTVIPAGRCLPFHRGTHCAQRSSYSPPPLLSLSVSLCRSLSDDRHSLIPASWPVTQRCGDGGVPWMDSLRVLTTKVALLSGTTIQRATVLFCPISVQCCSVVYFESVSPHSVCFPTYLLSLQMFQLISLFIPHPVSAPRKVCVYTVRSLKLKQSPSPHLSLSVLLCLWSVKMELCVDHALFSFLLLKWTCYLLLTSMWLMLELSVSLWCCISGLFPSTPTLI